MRPTPAELIAHTRRVLRDVVEPELTSDYARTRLREIRAALAQVDWDNAGLQLAHATEELRELLEEFRSWAEDEHRRKHFGEMPVLPTAEPHEFAAWQELHTQYAAMVVTLIDPLEDWLRANPDDHQAARLRQRLITATG